MRVLVMLVVAMHVLVHQRLVSMRVRVLLEQQQRDAQHHADHTRRLGPSERFPKETN